MVNHKYLISELGINKKHLDEKKQQTDYKIKYVVEYVKHWIPIIANRKNVDKLNFVDCMCNAGIYRDGDLCTAMRVLQLFEAAARKYSDKQFNIFLNDKDRRRMDICIKVIEKLLSSNKPKNLGIIQNTMDINDYLIQYDIFDPYFNYYGAVILFVDPYDFRTVIIERLRKFIERYYCEVIFNLFTSDFVRNGIDQGIQKCIGNASVSNKEELVAYIVKCLKTGKMKYAFPYEFRTSTNTEL